MRRDSRIKVLKELKLLTRYDDLRKFMRLIREEVVSHVDYSCEWVLRLHVELALGQVKDVLRNVSEVVLYISWHCRELSFRYQTIALFRKL